MTSDTVELVTRRFQVRFLNPDNGSEYQTRVLELEESLPRHWVDIRYPTIAYLDQKARNLAVRRGMRPDNAERARLVWSVYRGGHGIYSPVPKCMRVSVPYEGANARVLRSYYVAALSMGHMRYLEKGAEWVYGAWMYHAHRGEDTQANIWRNLHKMYTAAHHFLTTADLRE